MLKRGYRVLAGLLLAAVAAPLLSGQTTTSRPPNEMETRLGYENSHALNQRARLLFGVETFYSRDSGSFPFRRVLAGVAVHLNDHLSVEPYYEYIIITSTSGRASPTNRLGFAATVGAPWKGWTISDRNSGEQNLRTAGNYWRYINELGVQHPLRLGSLRLNGFVRDEVYYTSVLHLWYRNRVIVGAEHRLSERVAVEVYYLRQHGSHSWPANLDGIQMSLNTEF